MRLASVVAASAMLTCAGPGLSYGQSKCAQVSPVTTSGIGMAITRTSLQRELLVQFIVTNKTSGRVFFKSAQWDESAKASLDSGGQIYTPVAAGIETTQGMSATGCMNNPACFQDLGSFTDVDHGQSAKFSYRFNAATRMSENDSISLSVNLITRFGRAGEEEDAGQPRLLKFHFNSIPLGC